MRLLIYPRRLVPDIVDMSDGPTSAWHPALMPNSAADIKSKAQQPDAPPEDNVAQEAGAPPAPVSEPTELPQHDTSLVDEWFPEYESSTPWLEQEQTAAPADIDDAEAIPDTHESGDESSANARAAKHASTVSFARTVSHEVNWDGDGDGEDDGFDWSPPRTGTDPFKFMPPSDRTNSFPDVPPMSRPAEHDEDRPLPSSQAAEVMHEIEEDMAFPGQETLHTAPAPAELDSHMAEEGLEDWHAPQQIVGGDLLGPGEEASDERYAEGLPLISHETSLDQPLSESHDPFAQGDDDGDDFFKQIESSEDPASEKAHAERVLERKSTNQVLDSLTSASIDRTVSVPEAAEEELTDAAASHPTEAVLPTGEHVLDSGVTTNGDGEKPKEADPNAQWAAVFAEDDDDDDLLDDTAGAQGVDTTAFLGDDDGGFLVNAVEQTPTADYVQPTQQPNPFPPTQPSNRYLPTGTGTNYGAQPSTHYGPYSTATSVQAPVPTPFNIQPQTPPVTPEFGYSAAPPRPEPTKAASFVNQSKGGYQSPYDLPMEVVKPRKRQSIQHLPKATGTSSAPPPPPVASLPPRSASMQVVSPTHASASSLSPPGSSHSGQAPPMASPATALPKKSRESFFEELPMSSKPRPTSRHSHKSLPSPSQTSPYAPPQAAAIQGMPHTLPPGPQTYASPPMASPILPPAQAPAQTNATDIGNLVAPPRVSPYAPLPSVAPQPNTVPAPTNPRYSPAAASQPMSNGPVPSAPPPNKYSPAPALNRMPSASYAPLPSGATPSALSHQPRTSSPLAHFEMSLDRGKTGLLNHAEGHHLVERRTSSLHEPRLNRVPSLPPMKEDVEEDEPTLPSSASTGPPPHASYSPQGPRLTPPPGGYHPPTTLSPPKRVSPYSPQAPSATLPPAQQDFAPPQRSQTQSPGALYGNRLTSLPMEPVQRPSSVNDPTSPRSSLLVSSVPAAPSRPRGFSQNLNQVPPTDGREHDPLQRWKGSPLISWGVGGTLVTSFPKDVPRYGINQALPMIVRSPGEVKVKNIKELYPLEERLARFPGPLKGKSKKKETLAWLSAGIDTLERSLPNLLSLVSHEDKRAVERVLLWKILRLFIEHDGVLESNAVVDKAVRDVLTPNVDGKSSETAPMYAHGTQMAGFQESSSTNLQTDAIDSSTIEQIRKSLLVGDREAAVWSAADKRLWGHALLIAATASPQLYKKVAQEFVRKEVNYPSHNNESLGALYEVLSGNHEECVDELVPVHARAGLQLMATDTSPGHPADALAGLDKWRETLGLILSNRSVDDIRALNSLGNLLSSYGRAEAAHICFLFARNATVFGGLDDPQSNFVLVGADHRRQADQFAKETEALLLSEVYEYGLSLAGGSNVVSSPHLAAYKLQHAMTLAEYGHRDNALQYCEAIAYAITSQTRRSPYHHSILEAAVEDLMKRLREAPKEESSSWIPKPSMNKVSDTMWNRFNKFVAGDEDGSGLGSEADGGMESGPFAHATGNTPTISRPPSASGNTGMTMFGGQTHPNQTYPTPSGPVPPIALPATTRAASRYAPTTTQSSPPNPYEPNLVYSPPSRSSMERPPAEYNGTSHELPRRSLDRPSGYSPGYMPNSAATPSPS